MVDQGHQPPRGKALIPARLHAPWHTHTANEILGVEHAPAHRHFFSSPRLAFTNLQGLGLVDVGPREQDALKLWTPECQ